jgi:hypothetical protein
MTEGSSRQEGRCRGKRLLGAFRLHSLSATENPDVIF